MITQLELELDRLELIKKINLLSYDEISKLKVFLAGLETGKKIKEEDKETSKKADT